MKRNMLANAEDYSGLKSSHYQRRNEKVLNSIQAKKSLFSSDSQPTGVAFNRDNQNQDLV